VADIFTEITIGNMTCRNRLVRSATHAKMSDESGRISETEVDLYRKLSAGGVGLIIMGHAYVREDGKCSAGMMGIDSDDMIPALTSAAARVHDAGPARLISQINFGGAQVPPELRKATLPVPSARPDISETRAMTEHEISDLIESYVQAARKVWRAGLDGVQIHGAHGYFVNQMLSPLTNKRSDRYGGTVEKRSLFLRKVVEGIRAVTGPEFPILLKIASRDEAPGGLTSEETLRIVEMAVESGLSAVVVSGGMPFPMSILKHVDEEGIFLREAAFYKQNLSIPVISVHGFRSLAKMQAALQEGMADMVSLCRPFIRQPDLAELFRMGIIQQASCISCNLCLGKRAPLRCWQEKDQTD